MSESQVAQPRVLRKWFSAEQKLLFVEESLKPGVTISDVARKYNIGASSLVKWRKQMQTGALMGVKSGEAVPLIELKKLKNRINELERILGRKTAENEVLREAVKIGREKKLISRQPLPGVEDMDLD